MVELSVSKTPYIPWGSWAGSQRNGSPGCHRSPRARPEPFQPQKLMPAMAGVVRNRLTMWAYYLSRAVTGSEGEKRNPSRG